MNECELNKSCFGQYHHVIMVYKDKVGEMFLGHCYHNNGRDNAKYLLFLYKDAMPKMDFLSGWNYLDDNSISIVIVEVKEAQLGILDFLSCYKSDYDLLDLKPIIINNFQEIQKNLNDFEYDSVKCFLM